VSGALLASTGFVWKKVPIARSSKNGSDLSRKESDRKRKRNTIPKSQTLAKMQHPGLT
jgi:hypothetical protein